MTRVKTAVSAFALLALAAGGIGAMSLPTALHAQPAAQTDTTGQAPAARAAQNTQHHHHFNPAKHIEGRIAYVKAELKITPDQQPLFDKLAETMRANAKDRADTFAGLHQRGDKPMNAVERLELRERFSEQRATETQRLLAAFRPLYDTLSPDQKKVADELLSMHQHMHAHHHHA